MSDPITEWLDAIDVRLDAGTAEYGDQSFVRPVTKTVDEFNQELLDEAGWLYVLWCQAARKANFVRDQRSLRAIWRQNMHHRMSRNDRRRAFDHPAAPNGESAMADIEVLVLDCYEHRQRMLQRLQPIARAIEVAEAYRPEPYRGRRGSIRDPRSDD